MSPIIQFVSAAGSIALLCLFAFRNRKAGARIASSMKKFGDKLMASGPPSEEFQSVWFAGLVAEPPEFTQQLVSLQASLHRANAPVAAEALKRVTA